MRLSFPLSLAFLALLGCSPASQEVPPEPVSDAWVRLPAVDGRPAAAYFVLSGGNRGDTLIAIDSERVATIELHETINEDGVMRMQPIMSAHVPAGELLRFEPGGRHAMLFGLDPEITAGTPLALNFRFDSGRDVQIEARTIAAGDPPPSAE